MTERWAWLYLKFDLLGGRHFQRLVDDGHLLFASEWFIGAPAGHALDPLKFHVKRRVDDWHWYVLLHSPTTASPFVIHHCMVAYLFRYLGSDSEGRGTGPRPPINRELPTKAFQFNFSPTRQ